MLIEYRPESLAEYFFKNCLRRAEKRHPKDYQQIFNKQFREYYKKITIFEYTKPNAINILLADGETLTGTHTIIHSSYGPPFTPLSKIIVCSILVSMMGTYNEEETIEFNKIEQHWRKFLQKQWAKLGLRPDSVFPIQAIYTDKKLLRTFDPPYSGAFISKALGAAFKYLEHEAIISTEDILSMKQYYDNFFDAILDTRCRIRYRRLKETLERSSDLKDLILNATLIDPSLNAANLTLVWESGMKGVE